MRSGIGAIYGPTRGQQATRKECCMDMQTRQLKSWSKAELYAARAWFLQNQKLVGTMFAFNALNAIEQALEAK